MHVLQRHCRASLAMTLQGGGYEDNYPIQELKVGT